MLRFQLESRPPRDEFIRFWALADGTECVLAAASGVLEVRMIRNAQLLRVAACRSIGHGRDVARTWRVDHEVELALACDEEEQGL